MTTTPSRRFRTLVEEFDISVFVLDESGRFEYVSPDLAARVTGGPDPDALVGQVVTEYVTDGDADALTELLEETSGDESVTVHFDQWASVDTPFEILAVNGELLGCPTSEAVFGPAGANEELDGTHNEPVEFARVLEQLHDVTNRLYGAQTISEGLEIVIDAAVQVLGFDWCLLAAANEDNFEIQATSNDSPVNIGESPLSTDEGVSGAVYTSGESRLTRDVEDSDNARPTHSFIRSMVTVPVGSWGVFQALSKTPGAFDSRDQQLAETLIAPLATMIERVEREEELRESHKTQERQRCQIESLHTVATQMKAATTREEVYEMAIEAVEDILEFDICLIDEVEGDVLVPKAVGSNMSVEDYYEETPIDQQDSLGSLTYRKGETFVVDDLHAGGFAPAQSRYRSAISLALDDWGIFQIVSEEESAFDETERRLAELLTEHAVAAIDRIDRENELERRARELEEQNSRLDEFASIVSHDLRNPLNVASLRLEHALRTEDIDSLEPATDALDRMETIIDRVLTLARQGETIDEMDPVSLEYIANRCWDQVPADDATLTITGKVVVEADEDRLGHLFENLFRNSIEHTSGTVFIEVGPLSGEEGFYVEDDGQGIDEDARAKVFERGYTESESGTGLGLAIVEEVVDAHGWDIRVTSGEMGGARFEITDVDTEQ